MYVLVCICTYMYTATRCVARLGGAADRAAGSGAALRARASSDGELLSDGGGSVDHL